MPDLIPNVNDIQAELNRAWANIVRLRGNQPAGYENAFQHVYASALLASSRGGLYARALGEMKELNTWYRRGDVRQRSTRQDTWKDVFNNSIGRQIAAFFDTNNIDVTWLAGAAYEAITNGTAIFDVSDGRVPNDPGVFFGIVVETAEAAARGDYGGVGNPSLVNSLALPPKLFPVMQRLDDFSQLSTTQKRQLLDELRRQFGEFVVVEQRKAIFGEFGSVLGSSIGNVLGGKNKSLGIVYSSLLGEIGERLGNNLASSAFAENVYVQAANQGLSHFGQDVALRAGQAAVGTVSSWLSMELGEALGLEGFGAELFTTVGSTVTSHIIGNLLYQGPNFAFAGISTREIAEGLGISTDGISGSSLTSALTSAVGSFLGAKLGALVVSPQTQAGVALSSIGSAVGSFLAIKGIGLVGSIAQAAGGLFSGKLALIGNAVVPGVGAFVGFVLGALIGNLFGRKKPKIPTANAEVFLDYTSDQFQLGAMSVANGGNLTLVRDMATASRDTLNGLLTVLAGEMPYEATGWSSGVFRDGRWLAMDAGVQSFYGHTGGQLWIKLGSPSASQHNVTTADDAVSMGVMWSLDTTKVIGGDIFAKRALTNSPATDLTALLGDLQIAADYRFYAENRPLINGYIRDAYSSLSESDQSYYAQQKLLIDKLHTLGNDALTEDERDYYNEHKGLIDKIVSALEAQSLANPWIITLQRVSELRLDKWAISDFYGGLPGFLMSMGLQGSDAYMEDITVSSAGGLRIAMPQRLEGGPLAVLAQSDSNGWAVTVNDLYSIGYRSGAWTNTSGNDFIDRSSETAGVTITDYGTEERRTWNSHIYDPETGEYGAWVYHTVTATGGDDIFIGGSGHDTLLGYAGWDWLAGGAGDDSIDGGADNDVLIGGSGNDALYGRDGADYLAGGDNSDTLYAGVGDDTLIGGEANDSLYGEDGNDVLLVDQGDGHYDWMDGGAGTDALSFERWTSGVNFALGGGSVYENGYGGIENVIGSRHTDSLSGDSGTNAILAGGGDDTVWGADGDDVLEGGAGADALNGGWGVDAASYERSNAGVFVDLGAGEGFGGDATGDTWAGIENLKGSRFADELKGDAGLNVIDGAGGDDWLMASAGGDTLNGGEGADTADFSSGVYVNVNLAYGSAAMQMVDGSTHYQTLTGIEHVVGSSGADSIQLGSGDEFVTGGAGDDTLYGNAGGDTYYIGRGDGRDTIYEDNTGNNTLSLSGEVRVSDLGFNAVGGSGGYFSVLFNPHNDGATFAGNFAVAGNNRLKTIDFNGASQIDVSEIAGLLAESYSTHFYGLSNRSDLIVHYGGAGTWSSVYGAASGGWESQGNVFIGGAGGHSFVGSVGDDQYVFDAGSSWDIIVDAGGEDTLVFGSSISADEIQVVVEDDSLMVYYNNNYDRIRIAEGANRYIDAYTGEVSWNTIEFINAGGTWIDIRKLDIPWIDYQTYGGGWSPIAFDLNGDGLNLVSVEQSQVVSQLDSGKFARTGWVGPTDGLLAVDRDGNGRIDRLEEISFLNDAPGAKTDLEGLRGWDTNADGKLNAFDADWARLKIWVDRNQNGRSTAGELRTLEEAGITEIDLKGQATGYNGAHTRDNYVHNTLNFTWASGEKGTGYDIVLARRLLEDKGLTRDQVRGAWGDGKTGGQLGRLLNDPLAAANAALQAARPGTGLGDKPAWLRDRLTEWQGAPIEEGVSPILPVPKPTLDEVNALAQVDFSDHDERYAEEETRWADALAGKRPEGLDKEGVSVQTDLSLRPNQPSTPDPDAVARGGAFARPTLEQEQQGAPFAPVASRLQDSTVRQQRSPTIGVASSTASEMKSASRVPENRDEPTFAAADLLATAENDQDLWAPAPITLAGASDRRGWWLGSKGLMHSRGEAFIGDQGFGSPERILESAIQVSPQSNLLSQHQRLAQALAGFGTDVRGVGPAVWRRSGEGADTDLAAGQNLGRWRFASHDRMAS